MEGSSSTRRIKSKINRNSENSIVPLWSSSTTWIKVSRSVLVIVGRAFTSPDLEIFLSLSMMFSNGKQRKRGFSWSLSNLPSFLLFRSWKMALYRSRLTPVSMPNASHLFTSFFSVVSLIRLSIFASSIAVVTIPMNNVSNTRAPITMKLTMYNPATHPRAFGWLQLTIPGLWMALSPTARPKS